MRNLILLLIVIFLLSGCAFAPTQMTLISIPTSPEHLEVLTPTVSTSINTHTATPTLTLLPPIVESLTSQVTPTINFEYCKGWGELSSDGKWAICNKQADPVIFINQFNETWQFSYKSFYEQDVTDPCTELLHTTNDGMYIYFSLPLDCVRPEPWFFSTIGVFRINLTNGKVSKVLGGGYDFKNYSGQTYNVSISPTGRRMAYIVNGTSPITLIILDLNSGENRSISLDSKYLDGGFFEWSDDGTKMALLLASKPKDEYDDYLISFAFLDLLKNDPMVVFIQEKEFFWITANLEVTELGVRTEVYNEDPLFYDIKTGVVSIVPK